MDEDIVFGNAVLADDDDFEFGESYNESPAAGAGGRGGGGGGGSKAGDGGDAGGRSTHLQNQPFDEAVDLSDDLTVTSLSAVMGGDFEFGSSESGPSGVRSDSGTRGPHLTA